MARNNLTELVIIVEKNNPIIHNPILLQDLLKYQANIPKMKLTLHVFDDLINYHAIDFKNIKDINLSPLNNTELHDKSLVYEAIRDAINKVNQRNAKICTCRLPERVICVIIAHSIPQSNDISIDMPYHPWTNIIVKPVDLKLNINNADFMNYSIDGSVAINSPEQIIIDLNKLITNIRKTEPVILPEKIELTN